MFERFLESARHVVEEAQAQAVRMDQRQVRAEHLLLALASVDQGIAARVLSGNGLTPQRIEEAISATIAFESGDGPVTRADAEALKAIGIDLDEVLRKVEGTIGAKPVGVATSRRRGFLGKHLPLSPDAKRAIVAGVTEAKQRGDGYISPEHLLLGVLSQDKSVAVELLALLDTTAGNLRAQVLTTMKRAS
jgi:ATP-dependent Clp protease ATP-binding subunit ClpA